jgi:prefoldin subunit 5
VQEQQEMIDFLKKTIEDLKKNLERLEQLILDKK